MFKRVAITSIREIEGLHPIFDLSVQGKHEFVGNGILHHNSRGGLQQIPKTSVDPNIKKQLIPEQGMLYMVMDFSQAELRIMTYLSKDQAYLRAFREGQDPHLAIAAQKYGVDYQDALKIYEDESNPDYKLWKVRRKQAKQIVFGIIYGITAGKLAEKLSEPREGLIVKKEEAEVMMNDFFSQHPRIKKFVGSQERTLRRQGYIESLFGTKRRIPEIYSDDHEEVAYAIRLSSNFPCLLPSTQALSKTKGWVNYEDLEVGDEILAFDPLNKCSLWDPVERLNVFDYEGEMIRFHNKHIDVSSTPDHRWYVKKYRDKDYRVLTSDDLYNSTQQFEVPISADQYPDDGSQLTDDEIRFIGWYITDGSRRQRKSHIQIRLGQSISANPHKVKLIDETMSRLDVMHSRHSRQDGHYVTWDILDQVFANKIDHVVPDRKLNMSFISSLNTLQASILLDTMRLGDGWTIFTPKDKEQGSLVQALVILAGMSSSMFLNYSEGHISYFKDHQPSKGGQEFIRHTKDSYGIKFSVRRSVHTKSGYQESNHFHKYKYRGIVWCPTVKHGAFFIRTIGEDQRFRTLITGNCQSAASHMTQFGAILNFYDMRQGKFPPMKSVATVHDSFYYNVLPKHINVYTLYLMWDLFRNPETEKYFGFKIDTIDMSMDFNIGRNMAEELPFIPGYDYNKMLLPDFTPEAYLEEHKRVKAEFEAAGLDMVPKNYAKMFPQEFDKWKSMYGQD